ncbi:hypothetical protein HYR54_08655 [Candidatus Acetothermia bacterium]|nr:hypothetical protein [Candidatus Acetothermia bacterium]
MTKEPSGLLNEMMEAQETIKEKKVLSMWARGGPNIHKDRNFTDEFEL